MSLKDPKNIGQESSPYFRRWTSYLFFSYASQRFLTYCLLKCLGRRL